MKTLLFVFAALVAAQGAFAQDQKFYVFGQVGSAKADVDQASADAALRSAGATGLSSTVNDTAGAVLLGAGFKFHPQASVEIGYLTVADYTYKANFAQGTATDKLSVSGFGVNVVGYAPLADRVTAYGKLGIWSMSVDENATVSATGGFGQASQSASNTTPMIGVGVDFKVSDQVSLRVEYDYFSKVGDNNSTGDSKLQYLSAGVALSF